MRDRPHEEAMIENFREDPEDAIHLLNAILEDGDEFEIISFLHLASHAFGDGSIPNPTDTLPPEQLYRTLFPEGKPAFASLANILRGMGLRLMVAPATQDAAPPESESLLEKAEEAFPQPAQLAESSV